MLSISQTVKSAMSGSAPAMEASGSFEPSFGPSSAPTGFSNLYTVMLP